MIDTVWSQSYNNWLNVEWCRKFVTAICWTCFSFGSTLLDRIQSIHLHRASAVTRVQSMWSNQSVVLWNRALKIRKSVHCSACLCFQYFIFELFRLLHPRPVLAHLSTIQHSTYARLNDVPFGFLEENMGTHLHCFCICVQNFSPGYVGKQLCNQT